MHHRLIRYSRLPATLYCPARFARMAIDNDFDLTVPGRTAPDDAEGLAFQAARCAEDGSRPDRSFDGLQSGLVGASAMTRSSYRDTVSAIRP